MLLAPLSLAYGAVAAAHRALWLRPRVADRAGLPPLLVIGSLRAGGAGKTAVVLALARALREDGLRVGVLVYALRGNRGKVARAISPGSDWRDSSDEAVLLARESGARVFATRDRERAWSALGRTGEFDVLLSDDGLMDSRLSGPGAYRVVLTRPGENPGWTDLLPAGPYRLPVSSLAADDILIREGAEFTRRPVMPPEWTPDKPCWVLAGLGNPEAFTEALRAAGARVAGCSTGPDHGLPNLRRAREDALRAGAVGFLCSAKDEIKLEGREDLVLPLLRVGDSVTLAPEFRTFVRNLIPRAAPTS
jgi:tetraacyldisaccharide 4'-kinase